jgi:RNA recognition motif-containing protein
MKAYETTEKALKKEFEIYGPIRRVRFNSAFGFWISLYWELFFHCRFITSLSQVRLVVDKNTGKSRGYAFVEFEREKDMRG